MPSIFVDIILLFSFVPLLTNPFTYYFMSKRYRAILYAYLSYCYWNKDTEKFNKKIKKQDKLLKLYVCINNKIHRNINKKLIK